MAQAGALHAERLHVALSALNGIPFPWLKCGVLCSQLSAGIPALPVLLLQPTQAGGGDELGRRAQGEMCAAVEGPGLSQLCGSRGLSDSLLSLQGDPSHVLSVREL